VTSWAFSVLFGMAGRRLFAYPDAQ
jgi:hypothetical protein